MEKKLCLIAALAMTACATQYKGPSVAQVAKLCDQENHSMTTIPSCIDKHFSKHMKNWRDMDDVNARRLEYLLDYGNRIALRESSGKISADDAVMDFMKEIQDIDRIASAENKQRQQDAAARSAAAFAASALILSSQAAQQPTYVAPPPVLQYPSDTTINVYQGRPYRFWDSRPYQ